MDEKLCKLFEALPEFLSSQKMVDLGIYDSVQAVYAARRNGSSPRWIKLRHKIVYEKSTVIEWLNNGLTSKE